MKPRASAAFPSRCSCAELPADRWSQPFESVIYSCSGRSRQAAGRARLCWSSTEDPLTPTLALDAQASRLDVKNSANDATLVAAKLTYSLSKRTAVYTTVGHISNGGAAAISVSAGGSVGAGMNQSGVMAGVRHFF